MLRHLDLFSGIGGFALAASWTGSIETVGFCEIDPWCRRVLAKHWPGVPQHDDVKTLTGSALERFGPVDLITGGYPCQPFSLAGQRRGADDPRHLWPYLRTVVDQARPRFLLLENVAGHISMGLDVVLADLEADGYTCGAVVVPAGAVNALHRRDRVWIMAYAERRESQSGSFAEQVRRWAGEAEQIGMGGSRAAVADSSGDVRRASGNGGRIAPDWTGTGTTVANADRESAGRHARTASGSQGPHAGWGEDNDQRLAYGGGDCGTTIPNPDEVGWGAGVHVVCTGQSDTERRCADVPDAQRRRQPGSRLRRDACDQAAYRERAAGDAVDAGPAAEGPEAAWPVDPGAHGLPTGLVRRPARRSSVPRRGPVPIHARHFREDPESSNYLEHGSYRAQATDAMAPGPEAIRDAWADGTWEDGLPRVVTSEPDRKHKLMGAGNAIVPLVAYELLSVMIGEAA